MNKATTLHWRLPAVRQFMLIFLLLATLITLLGVPAIYIFEEQRVGLTVQREQGRVDASRQNVIKQLDQAVRDLIKLSELVEMRALIESPDDSQLRAQLTRYFLLIMDRNAQYAQLRYIDAAGWERVRIDNFGQRPRVVGENNLQNKSERYYFTETMALPSGSFFKSPFDLNIEAGTIEQPLRPMLRIGLPLDDATGHRRGVIMLNYNGRQLLETLAVTGDDSVEMFLNKQGYWLKGATTDQEWGWLLGRPELTLATQRPALWQRITDTQQGALFESDGLYLFDTIEPLSELSHLLQSAADEQLMSPLATGSGDDPYRWKLVHFVPTAALQAQALYNQPLLVAFSVSLYLIMAAIAWMIAQLNHRQRRVSVNLLRETERREEEFRTYLESAPDGVLVCDSRGTIQRVNSRLESMLGYTRDELLGQPAKIITPQFADGRPAGIRATFFQDNAAVGASDEVEIIVQTRRGEDIPVNVSIKVIESPDGVQVIGALRDISAVKEAEAKLTAAIASAETASHAKSHFLANMSHEIRTPLNAVLGSAYLLSLDKTLAGAAAEQVARINVAGKTLLTIINDILDLSKIEAGEFLLERAPMRLSALLMDIEAVSSVQAEAKGIELRLAELPEPVVNDVVSDPVRLRQILINLVNNALKFTDRGVVSISVALTAPPAGEGGATEFAERSVQWVKFEVSDSGIGISAEAQALLFEAFRQADTSTTRNFGGTGLGLTIVRQLCEAMGGTVEVDSELGSGSVFTVVLPLWVATTDEMEQAGMLLKPLEVLIAEDDRAHRELLLAMCEKLGWQAEAVDSGEALVALVAEREARNAAVDCLIVDWQLTGIDGLEALQQIASARGGVRLPRAVMVTSYDLNALRASPLAHLPDAILTKPIDMSELYNEMNLAFAKHFGARHPLASSSHLGQGDIQWLTGVRVLLVDDSQMNIDVATAILELEGAIVESKLNGLEALCWLREHPDAVDVVLMDVQMPVMDGNAATAEIRQDPRLAGLPVIALTAGALLTERKKSIDAGMDDYLTKPFDPERMVRVIRQYAELKLARSIPVVERAGSGETSQPWPEIDGIDSGPVKERTNNDLGFYKRLVHNFFTDYAILAEPLTLPAERGPLDELATMLHKLAGNAGLLGAHTVHSAARAAEIELRGERDRVRMAALLRQLHDSYCQLTAAAAPLVNQITAERAAVASAAAARDRQPHRQLSQAQLAELLEALKQRKFTAVNHFRALADGLRSALGAEQFARLEVAMDALKFDDAQRLLRTLTEE